MIEWGQIIYTMGHSKICFNFLAAKFEFHTSIKFLTFTKIIDIIKKFFVCLKFLSSIVFPDIFDE